MAWATGVDVAIFSAFPLFADFREALQSLVSRTLPPQISSTVLRYVGEFAEQAARLTAFGLVMLAFAAVLMIMTVDHVLNDIWQVRARRPFGQRMLIYWALLTLAPILIGASLTASSYVWSPSAEEVKRIPWLLRGFFDYAPVILSGFAYSALYVFVPNRTVRWSDALIGGFVAAILAELLKVGFAFFIWYRKDLIHVALLMFPLWLLCCFERR